MHLPNVHAVVTGIREVFNPTASPVIGVLQNTRDVGVLAGEETGSRWCAGSCRNMALSKAYAFVYEPVHVRRDEVREAKRRNRVVALLVGEEKDYVGSCGRHRLIAD